MHTGELPGQRFPIAACSPGKLVSFFERCSVDFPAKLDDDTPLEVGRRSDWWGNLTGKNRHPGLLSSMTFERLRSDNGAGG